MSILASALPLALFGCAGHGAVARTEPVRPTSVAAEPATVESLGTEVAVDEPLLRTVVHEEVASPEATVVDPVADEIEAPRIDAPQIDTPDDDAPEVIADPARDAMPAPQRPFPAEERVLVAAALAANPRLARLQAEAAAAWARVPQVEALPDPMLGVEFFGEPTEQGARLTFSQMIPWLKRLTAHGQETAFVAMSLDQVWQAESLMLAGDVQAAYYRLYLVERQIEINEANQTVLESLVEIATQRVGQGQATQGDVLLGTVELAQLTEDLIALRKDRATTVAALNALLNRPADTPVAAPASLATGMPPLDARGLAFVAYDGQPEIISARLRLQAATWGIRVAELQRVPDTTMNVEVGRDEWEIEAAWNVPLWNRKYRAIRTEAVRKHNAAHASIEELLRKYDALLVELVERARAADATARLYEQTILPQARQTLEADQLSYAQGRVEFDRLIRDFRNLLTLEVGYHRAVSDLATAIARLEQAVGVAVGNAASPAAAAPAEGVLLPLPEPDDTD